ncbi:MAG: hypothetical protein ACOC4C_01025 [Fibrobacterota bacterium]
MDTQLIKALESGVKKQHKRIRNLMIAAVLMIVLGLIIDYGAVVLISPRGYTFWANIIFLIGAFLVILGLSILIMWPIAQIRGKMQMKKAEARVENMQTHKDNKTYEQ